MGALETTLERLLARRESHGRLRRLNNPRSDLVDFSSNDYLSLSQDRVLRDSLIAHLTNSDKQHSPSSSSRRAIGSGGSRLLDGNSAFAENLERKIAGLHGSEAALLFNSAYDANVGLLSCVPGPEDVILYDSLIHASVHDGMRLSRATRKIHFTHDSIIRSTRQLSTQKDGDNATAASYTASLEFVLRQLVDADQKIGCGVSNVFICVEALYSMDGDVADLQYISDVVKRLLPCGNGYIIVDEAHSVGILGDSGGGLVCQVGLQDRIWARVVGFGKAFGCAGGAVLCSSIARLYLVNYARTLIYTTAMSFPSLASIDAAYDYMMTRKAHERREQLKVLIQYCHIKLKSLDQGSRQIAPTLRVPGDLPSSPIIPVFTSHPKSLARHCQESGYMIRPIVAPTVPVGQERVRICLHASNTIAQIDGLCGAIEAWLDTLGTKSAMIAEGNGQTDLAAEAELQDREPKAIEAKL
ncbi:PLP-dependent transferase [Xylaria venustula]|nr:PLP-dependent transferase [Xylaria venustula]